MKKLMVFIAIFAILVWGAKEIGVNNSNNSQSKVEIKNTNIDVSEIYPPLISYKI